MSEFTNSQKTNTTWDELLMQDIFQVEPFSDNIDLNDEKRFSRLKLSPGQKRQVSELLQHLPSAAAAGELTRGYTVKFPDGLQNMELAPLKQGGWSTLIKGENGKFAGSASLYHMYGQAVVLGVFTAMSIATGQFFLFQINKELHQINKKLDDILEFLYGEKRAELLSEVSFIREAYDNYSAIMKHDLQRGATITNIQEAKKIAMRDIEFYLSDFSHKIESANNMKDADKIWNYANDEIKKAKENLDLSLQLYLMSSLLEVYYSQNFDVAYIDRLKKNMEEYVDSCNNQIQSNYGALSGAITRARKGDEEVNRSHAEEIEALRKATYENYHNLCEKMYDILKSSTQEMTFYISTNGEVYHEVI